VSKVLCTRKGCIVRRDCRSIQRSIRPYFPATIMSLSTSLACSPELRDEQIEEQMKIFTGEVMPMIASRCGGRAGAARAGAQLVA
jgi:hypothetical protein